MTSRNLDQAVADANEASYGVYLLSLRAADDPFLEGQRQALSSRLGHVETVEGIPGRAMLTADYYSALARSFARHRRVISPSEVGCALSHVRIMERFLSSGKHFAVIFEDDVQFSDASFAMVRHGLRAMSSADTLVAGCQQGLEYLGPVIGTPVDGEAECFAIDPSCWHLVRRTCAYVVGRLAAEHIVSVQDRGLVTADAFELLCPSRGRLLFCNAFSHPTSGDISSLEKERNLLSPHEIARPLVNRLVTEVRKAMAARFRSLRMKYLIANGRSQVIRK